MAKNPDESKQFHTTSAGSAPPAVPSGPLTDELIGTTYLGKYELLEVLGVGGMGVIYLGRQIFLDRQVAIKLLKNNLASVRARTRFHQEAKAASALKHPGIVSILDFGVDDLDRPYMVMEHVEGCTIADLLDERVTMSVEDLLPVFFEICDALSEAHKKGIVHRDLKPSNIMLVVDDDGEPHIKILDFGIAKMLDADDRTFQDLTKTGDALGTPLYMSPEQINGKNVTYKSDLYSLGCMLYACLTGAPPFIGESKMATMDLHLTEKPMSLRVASDGLEFPAGVEGIVMRLLEKKPENRFESADELKNALLAMADQNGIMPGSSESGLSSVSQSFSGINKAGPAGGAGKYGVANTNSSGRYSTTNRSTEGDTGVDDFSDSEFTQRRERLQRSSNTTYWKSDLTERVRAARGSKFKELPKRSVNHQMQNEEGVSDGVEASLNRSFVIAGAVVSVLVIIVAAFILFGGKPQSSSSSSSSSSSAQLPQDSQAKDLQVSQASQSSQSSPLAPDIIERSADELIKSKLRAGAEDSSLMLKEQDGLTDQGLQMLSGFKMLRNLDLRGNDLRAESAKYFVNTPVTTLTLDVNRHFSDDGTVYLARMPNLQYLSLNATDVSDAGLVNLAKRPTLISLWLGYDKITDQGIKNLAPATSSIRSLFLNDCNITDTSATEWLKFKYMFSLDLSHNPKVSDRTLEILQAKPRGIECLSLANDSISDAGVRALTRYPNLRVLDLSGIALSPRALSDLGTIRHLSNLYLVGCGLSPFQISKLGKALPGCAIETNNRISAKLL